MSTKKEMVGGFIFLVVIIGAAAWAVNHFVVAPHMAAERAAEAELQAASEAAEHATGAVRNALTAESSYKRAIQEASGAEWVAATDERRVAVEKVLARAERAAAEALSAARVAAQRELSWKSQTRQLERDWADEQASWAGLRWRPSGGRRRPSGTK